MNEEEIPDPEVLTRSGDPPGLDAIDHQELIRYVMTLGATADEVGAASNLGELALGLVLRPRGTRKLREIVATLGADWTRARPILTAAGLPDDLDAVVTDDEAAAVELWTATGLDLLGDAAAMQLSRVAGNAMARMAETLVGVLRLQIEIPRRQAGVRSLDVVTEYVEMAQSLLPVFLRTLDAALRQQIVKVTEQMWSTDEEISAVTMKRAVGFVDLVDYTTTTNRLSVRELTQVLIAFDQLTGEVVAQENGQIVKTIGDEVMFVTEDPTEACRIARNLLDTSGDRHPQLRVGVACGEMISVFGDLYGPDVNLAARLVAAAEPGTAFVSERVRAVAGGFGFELLPTLNLKGFPGPTRAYRLGVRVTRMG